jgi:transposase-like protein
MFAGAGSLMTSSFGVFAGNLRYKLSYRDLAKMMSELGTSIARCTILRWVVRYSADFAQYWRCYKSQWAGRGAVTRRV